MIRSRKEDPSRKKHSPEIFSDRRPRQKAAARAPSVLAAFPFSPDGIARAQSLEVDDDRSPNGRPVLNRTGPCQNRDKVFNDSILHIDQFWQVQQNGGHCKMMIRSASDPYFRGNYRSPFLIAVFRRPSPTWERDYRTEDVGRAQDPRQGPRACRWGRPPGNLLPAQAITKATNATEASNPRRLARKL